MKSGLYWLFYQNTLDQLGYVSLCKAKLKTNVLDPHIYLYTKYMFS